MQKRTHTVRTFHFEKDLLPIVEAWAKDLGFIVEVENNKILCEKGMGLMTSPVQVILEETDGDIRLEAFLKVDPITMFASLFMAPDEMHLESGDGQLIMERKFGRDKVNKLLEQLGQPPIE
jgi:hypothetical protein